MNNESRSPRKELIKNITIVFLTVMLLLTFFSNTIMNYSLPQVSAVYVSQGTVSEQIRGSGTVTPAESYEIKFDQSRTIKSIPVTVGQTVKKGDIIFELEDEESTELTEAQNTLDSLELEYQKALLTYTASSEYQSEYFEISAAEKKLQELKDKLAVSQNKGDALSAATDKYKTAKEEADRITKAKTDYTAQLASVDTEDMLDLKGDYYTTLRAAKDAVNDAEKENEKAVKAYDEIAKDVAAEGSYEDEIASKQKSIKYARAELNELYSQYYSAEPDTDTSSISTQIATKQTDIEILNQELSALYSKSTSNLVLTSKLNQAEQKKIKCEKKLTAAKDKLAEETRRIKLEIKLIIDKLDERLTDAEKRAASAEEDKTNAEASGLLSEAQLIAAVAEQEKKINDLTDALILKQQTDSVTNSTAKLDLEAKKKAVEEQQKKVDKLKSTSFDAVIKAQMGGIIDSISATSGSKIEAGATAAVINVSDMGYTLEFAVKTEQARKIRVGDKAEITSWYWGDDFSAELSQILPDKNNPQTQKLLVFKISGTDITTGQTISLSMGSKGQSYSATVPNNAIREDSNGKFVLVMEAKSSPLGNRYKAVRYDIEVIAKDDTKSAVNGLLGSEFVITTSTKPIAAGDQVRPAD